MVSILQLRMYQHSILCHGHNQNKPSYYWNDYVSTTLSSVRCACYVFQSAQLSLVLVTIIFVDSNNMYLETYILWQYFVHSSKIFCVLLHKEYMSAVSVAWWSEILQKWKVSLWILMIDIILRVNNQHGIARLYAIVEIYHSGWKPSILGKKVVSQLISVSINAAAIYRDQFATCPTPLLHLIMSHIIMCDKLKRAPWYSLFLLVSSWSVRAG